MDPRQEFPEIARGLLEKTRKENVKWSGTRSGAYRLELPQSVIRLQLHSPQDESPFIVMSILSKQIGGHDGETIAVWEVSKGEPHWDLFNELYQQVIATKWQPVREDIQKFLGKGIASKVR